MCFARPKMRCEIVSCDRFETVDQFERPLLIGRNSRAGLESRPKGVEIVG
jgi:hypothetical protein